MAPCSLASVPTDLLVWATYAWVGGGLTLAEAATDLAITLPQLTEAYGTWGINPGDYGAFIAWIEADPARARAWSIILGNEGVPLPAVPCRQRRSPSTIAEAGP